MDVFLIKAAQLILAFAILVIIHEFGHFLFARIFGVKVEKFYIFFDPWFEIFKWKPGKYWGLFGKSKRNPAASESTSESDSDAQAVSVQHGASTPALTSSESEKESESKSSELTDEQEAKANKSFWGDTEYGIGWLPLGGYCKIAGMIDESMDREQMKQPAKPWEFRTKPAWQRLLIMVAGVLFNFILAIIIYAGIVWTQGEKYVTFKESKGLLMYSDVAQAHGFRDGDIPLAADGKEVNSLDEDIYTLSNARQVQVLRNGADTVTINLPSNFMALLDAGLKSDSRGVAYIAQDAPVVVKEISNSEAEKAGLRVGDRIIGINDVDVPGVQKFFSTLPGHANQTVGIKVERTNAEQATDTVVVPIKLDGASKIGFMLQQDVDKLFNTVSVEYGLLESVPRGIEKGSTMMYNYVTSLKQVFTKEGAQSVGGFGAIGNMFPSSWDWLTFWTIAAFLSVALAFMNILPIPGLDGGHVLFLLYEVITRRKPGDKFLERAQIAGMVLLLLLLVYANGMDIVRLFK